MNASRLPVLTLLLLLLAVPAPAQTVPPARPQAPAAAPGKAPTAPVVPPVASPPASEATHAWRSPEGWRTELRRHPDGTTSCATAKSFPTPHLFGILFLRSGNVMLFSVIDQQDPFARPGLMTLAVDGRAVGAYTMQAKGAALATVEGDSAQVRAMFARLPPGKLTINAVGREYSADLAGIEDARAAQDACIAQLAAAPR